MHVHANQINPAAQTDALYAAERAAAKRAAEGTRRKLLESASELAGEAESEEGCVVKLREREAADEQRRQGDQQARSERKGQKQRADAEKTDGAISDWA
jgi:hypothetical protein